MAKAEILRLRNPGVEVTPEEKNFGETPAPLIEGFPSITGQVETTEKKGRYRKYKVETLVISYPWRKAMILSDSGLIASSTQGGNRDTREVRTPIGSRPQKFYVRQFGDSLIPEFTIRIAAKEIPS